MTFDITLENAAGMSHEEVGKVTKELQARGIDLHTVRSLLFMRKEGWIGLVFRDGTEALIEGVLQPPAGPKVFLPRMN